MGGAALGAAGGAAFALWEAGQIRQSRRSALVNLKEAGASIAVPAVERRRVPLTPRRGWNVSLLNVQL